MRSLLLFLFSALLHVCGAFDYYERLDLKPLPDGALLANFHFRSNTTSAAFEQQNFRHFPRSLGQILQHAHAKELHLRFSTGRWDDESWGVRPWNGSREGGTGVEAWAWVESNGEEEAEAAWLTLTSVLSGLFCASLNFIDSTKTIRPIMAFSPEGHHAEAALNNLHLLHGTLPHEVVCTENLTPFLKLLPCKGRAGISSLLDGHKLFDASWQSMAIDVRPVCDGTCVIQIEQTVDMVLDIARSKRPRDNPIPRPIDIHDIPCDTSKPYHAEDSCYPLDSTSEPSWSLTEVFGRSINGACSITDGEEVIEESVCITVPPEREIIVESSGAYSLTKSDDEFTRCYQPAVGHDFDLRLPEQAVATKTPMQQPPLYAARSITGHGQERGGVEAVLTNPSLTSPISLIYLETLPWFMKPYLHTLRTSLSGNSSGTDAIKETYYRPAVDRKRPTHLELLITIPPASTLTLTYDFEKALLRYTEYPPDANRGFDAGPAIIRILPDGNGSNVDAQTASKGTYLRTTTLLLYLPTPDFSMPYNVIILTSTVMALGFGSIFNLLVRRFVAVDEVEPSKLAAIPILLRGRIKGVIAKFTNKGIKKE